VPLSFLPGQTGGLFREFGFTLAVAVVLSGIVALSLCPMIASRVLTGSVEETTRTGFFGTIGRFLGGFYRRTLHAALNTPLVVVVIAVLLSGLAVTLFPTIRSELTPSEDRASAFLRISAPQGVSLDYLSQRMREVETLIQPLRDSGEIVSTFAI